MLYSHPNKLLYVHLEETAQKCELAVSSSNVCYKYLPNNLLKEIAYIIGYLHDIGKSTKFFQDYIKREGKIITGPKKHALLSALYAKEYLNLFCSQNNIYSELKDIIKIFAYIAIKRHHSNIKNFSNDIFDKEEIEKGVISKQILSIEASEFIECLNPLYDRTKIMLDLKDFLRLIDSENLFIDFENFLFFNFTLNDSNKNENERLELFYIFMLLYSTLLLSDKGDVILDNKILREKYDNNCLSFYISKKKYDRPQKEIDKIKNKAFNSALNNFNKIFNINNHFYSITLPTGLGKTILSFAIALELKKKLNLDYSRIIITIPFTSIIDQNYEIYREIVNTNSTAVILKHHHLSEKIYKTNEDTLDYDKSEFLIETWHSEIIVTTFVQLLESILKVDKSKIMKIPNITNSIIIMDEIQTIDYKYWELINTTFKIIAKLYNCYFILMTATKPLIFLPEKEIIEIIPEYKDYYTTFNRTKIINKAKEPISYNDFISIIIDYINTNLNKNILIILNTKKATLQCFNDLKYQINDDNDEIYYLSTLKTPFERKNIIKKIKDEKNTKRKIIVSTQLIEAGVDISVSTIFRELAPLDAIIQSAGRANRYSEKEEISEIYLYKIEEFITSTKKVYGNVLINKTENVIKKITGEIEEIKYLDLIEDYFREIKNQSENIISEELNKLIKWEFEEINKFSYIEEGKNDSLFVILNEEAEQIWNQFISIMQDDSIDPFSKKSKFGLIKQKFYDYVINIPIPYNKKDIDFEGSKEFGFYLWKYYEQTNNYSYSENNEKENTGYKESEYVNF